MRGSRSTRRPTPTRATARSPISSARRARSCARTSATATASRRSIERFGTFYSGFFGFSRSATRGSRPSARSPSTPGLTRRFASNRVRLSATYFYTRLQEVVRLRRHAERPVRALRRLHQHRRRARPRRRAERRVRADARWLDLSASYTTRTATSARAAVAGVLRAFAVPDHQFTLVATQRIGRRVAVNFDLVAVKRLPRARSSTRRRSPTAPTASTAYARADLTASYTLPLDESRRLRFFGKVENVFDRDYYENGFRTPGVQGRAGAALHF